MRPAITRADLRKYLEKSLSVQELEEFELRLREGGLADDVESPSASSLYAALRADAYEEPFDRETLIQYVQGTAEPRLASVIEQIRRIDDELDASLSAMEAAKRQVDASLQLAPAAPAPRRRSWLVLTGWGLAAAAAVLIVVLVLPRKGAEAPVAMNTPSVQSVLSTAGFDSSTTLGPTAQEAMQGASVAASPEVQAQLTSLASPTKDPAKMIPARCLVLPESTTRLLWQGIAAKTVTCSLRDASGAKLAEAVVQKKNSWVYRKPLVPGEYRWSAAWIGKGGKPKIATRVFRVVDAATAAAIEARAAAAGDPVSRAVVLAENGYTYQSLQLLDALLAKSPQARGLRLLGLRRLRDSIASQAIL